MVKIENNNQSENMHPRVEKIRDLLITHQCDCFFSLCPIENRYLSGFTGSTSAIFITPYESTILTDFRYKEQIYKEVFHFDIQIAKNSIEKEIFSFISNKSYKKILIHPLRLSYHFANELEKNCNVSLYPLLDPLTNLRVIKQSDEIQKIRKACEITERAVFNIVYNLKEGITEKELSAEIEYQIKKNGADSIAFDTIVLFGSRSSLPHGKSSSTPLQAGDIILIDCGCTYEGYCADLTRTFVFGTVPGTMFTDIYQIVLEAQLSALSMVKDGIPAKDVDAQARKFITAHGFGEYFGHGLGHGVGLEIHETPRLNKDSEAILKEGMVITIEPGIYIPGKGGVRIEDTILVTKEGFERLTTSSKELQVLPIYT